jgi:hypothetical protein
MKQAEIIDALAQQQTANEEYWTAFDTATFFQPIGTSWSPAEAVRHLTKSTRPVVLALNAPKLLLRIRFGKSKRPSVSYEELRTRYRGLLDAGGKAGCFAPSSQTESDLVAWRERILATYAGVNEDLRRAIGRWSEKKLDDLQLPHPLLGKLTVREMLLFTLYHQRHHIDVVRRRLDEATV